MVGRGRGNVSNRVKEDRVKGKRERKETTRFTETYYSCWTKHRQVNLRE